MVTVFSYGMDACFYGRQHLGDRCAFEFALCNQPRNDDADATTIACSISDDGPAAEPVGDCGSRTSLNPADGFSTFA